MRTVVSLVSAAVLSLGLASAALAGQPANQACLGTSVAAAAHGGRDFGALASSVAKDVRGVGEEVQIILAGEFPDEGFPNTCND
jgi:hypothetical protein